MSSSESDESEREMQTDDDEQEEPDLDASDTESDEGDEDEEMEHESPKKLSLEQKVAEDITKKYAERQGKQLYIRFPHKLPEDDDEFQEAAKALSPLILKAHKPRQKHARFCLVDFGSREDRDTALKAIKAAAKKGGTKVVVSIPRTESDEFVQELVKRKVNTLEKKKAKARLRRASKLALRSKNFTSSIVITNLPQSASAGEVRRLFPNAVDVHIKPRKGKLIASSIATITLPSTMEARAAMKKKQSLGGTELIIRFDTQKAKKSGGKAKKNNIKKSSASSESKTDEIKVYD
ncbi:nucleolin [Bactrocera tryoni]|uniref:nucleolin n=1 Tax=Bactrocera tryoni TaxID=59916 RepID=UPI001A9A145F|nr:nucleolin [Bactrocera tryoni]